MYNNKDTKILRQELRKTMPKGEYSLWQKLRRKQLGYKFFRQYSIGSIVLDFYCPALRLGVEVDGITHEDPVVREKDIVKERFLQNKKITLLRFTSNNVWSNRDQVVETISYECEQRARHNSPQPSL